MLVWLWGVCGFGLVGCSCCVFWLLCLVCSCCWFLVLVVLSVFVCPFSWLFVFCWVWGVRGCVLGVAWCVMKADGCGVHECAVND